MNTSNTIFPNIGNRNKTCQNFLTDDASRMSSRVSKSTTEIAQQKDPSIISQNSRVGAEHNEIHSNPQKRKVDLKGAETYLKQPERNGVFCHESIGNSTNNTKNLLGSREWPSCTETVKSFFTSLVPQMKEGCKAFSWDPKPKVIAASMLSIYSPGLIIMGKGLTILYLLFDRASVIKAGSEIKTTDAPDKVEINNKTTNSKDLLSEGMSTNNAIEINDLEMLEKIGTNNDFPSDGNYELTANIDATNFTQPIKEFSGNFNGNNHKISNLQCPLIVKIIDGTIRNLIISHANIHDRQECIAVLACFAGGNSTISHIQFEDSQIQQNKASDYNVVGMATLKLSGSAQIENVSVKNCTIDTAKFAAWVGYLAGIMFDTSTSENNTIDKSSLITHKHISNIGALFGSMFGATQSSNDKVNSCRIEANGKGSDVGGAVGSIEFNAKIKNARVSESIVQANNEYSCAGVLVGRAANVPSGEHASISESTAINSRAMAIHKNSKAGIWVGLSSGNIQIYNNTHSNCTIESYTPGESTTTANLTTTEPAMIVDGAPFLPLGVLFVGAGATVTSIGLTGCFSYSLYHGYQEGKRGRSLAMHPFVSFGKLLNNCCKSCTGFQLLSTDQREVDISLEDRLITD